MLDKIAGALSNSIVGFVAIAAAMTNDVDPDLLTTANIETFKTAAFYAPLGVIILAFLVFTFKVSLTEKKHGEIVEILKQNMSGGGGGGGGGRAGVPRPALCQGLTRPGLASLSPCPTRRSALCVRGRHCLVPVFPGLSDEILRTLPDSFQVAFRFVDCNVTRK